MRKKNEHKRYKRKQKTELRNLNMVCCNRGWLCQSNFDRTNVTGTVQLKKKKKTHLAASTISRHMSISEPSIKSKRAIFLTVEHDTRTDSHLLFLFRKRYELKNWTALISIVWKKVEVGKKVTGMSQLLRRHWVQMFEKSLLIFKMNMFWLFLKIKYLVFYPKGCLCVQAFFTGQESRWSHTVLQRFPVLFCPWLLSWQYEAGCL